MTRYFQHWLMFATLLLSALLLTEPASAQGLLSGSAEESSNPVATQTDAYGRDTPRGLATGLIAAFAGADYARAAVYLEKIASDNSRDIDAREAKARLLQQKLDRSGSLLPFAALSNDAAGASDDGLALDQEQIGQFRSSTGDQPLIAMRLNPAGVPPYWVISAKSLNAIVAAEPAPAAKAITSVLPDALNKTEIAGAPAADWLVLTVLATIIFFGMRLLFGVLLRLLRMLVAAPETHRGYQFAEAAFPPLGLYLAVVLFFLSTQKLQVAIVARQVLERYATIVAWVAFVWFLWRLIDMLADLWGARMARSDRRRAMAALVFVRRSAKTLLGMIAFVAVLDTIGINVTTGIAALGLGGLAIALGAQKTIENLVGSLAVIIDQPVRVGDFCKVGDVLGTVEDIGMRSTQLRTMARTVVTIPNGQFSSQQIENYSQRDRFLFDPVIGVTYDVDAAQMRRVLGAIRQLLDDNENVIEGARVRFVGFNSSSLDIEVFAYIRTHDYALYLGMQEELLLQIMDAICAQGASMAFPTQTIVMKAET